MPLWCTACHTRWTERVLMEWQPCPFKDCSGTLTQQQPAATIKPKAPKEQSTYPLLETIRHDEG